MHSAISFILPHIVKWRPKSLLNKSGMIVNKRTASAKLQEDHYRFKKMKIETRIINDIKIAEISSAEILINSAETGLDLLGNMYYQGFDKIIINERNVAPDFFDLKNGNAGEVLQKFSNYRVRLAVVGDFTKYNGKSIKDFIYESNKLGHICFVKSTSEAIALLSNNGRKL